jgi:hypothetical protein
MKSLNYKIITDVTKVTLKMQVFMSLCRQIKWYKNCFNHKYKNFKQ